MKELLKVFTENNTTIPIWLMRQAGRYLPEYQKIRKTTNNFLELCYDIEKATQITMQPVIRYDLDAAIIFSDILILLDALGWDIKFVHNSGPSLRQFQDKSDFQFFKTLNQSKLNKVYQIIREVKNLLNKDKVVIGFVGGPWTVMAYMLEGKSDTTFQTSRYFIYQNFQLALDLINYLTEQTIIHLIGQIESGVDLVQIFDSWAGILGEEEYNKFVIYPTKRIISTIKTRFPSIPIIGFPRNSGFLYDNYINNTGIDAISVDYNVPLGQMMNWSQKVIVQGNLDPAILLTNNKQMIKTKINKLISSFKNKRFLFNLGHGVLKNTPINNIEYLVNCVKEFKY